MKNLLLTASLLFGAVLSGIEIAPGTRWTLYPASNTAKCRKSLPTRAFTPVFPNR